MVPAMPHNDCRFSEYVELKDITRSARSVGAAAVRPEPLLDDLPCRSMRDTVCSAMRIRPYRAGSVIIYENQKIDEFLVLVTGRVMVRKISVDGKQVTVARLEPGSSCSINIGCLLNGLDYPAELVADSDLLLGVVPRYNFLNCMKISNRFREQVFECFGKQMKSLMEFVSEIAFESIDVRIAKWLVKSSEHRNELPVTHQGLADEIGSVREVVSRELNRLKKKGLVELGRGRLRVIDRDALARLAAH